jgi:ATP-dependent protease HslVU (ClpYQ) peptidase subunit
MTLIIGMRCTDGIVMGADGAATLGTVLGQGTVMQSVKKIEKITGKFMIGVSGPVGVGQRIIGQIGQLFNSNKLNNVKSFQAMQIIRQELAPILMPEIKHATEAMQLTAGVSRQWALTQTVLAAPIDGQLRLYCFGCTGDPEEMTDNIPFVAIGSGQNLADPFLAFIKTIFWKDSVPNRAEGIFATFWSLHHAIRRNTGGVADPKQIVELYRDSQKNIVVKELEPDELEETVKAAENHLSQFKKNEGEPPPTAPAVN